MVSPLRLDDFDLLDGENFAAGDTWIAQSVNIDIIARLEATDENAVAKGIAALAGAKRYPGR